MDPITAKLEATLSGFKARLSLDEVERFQDATLAQFQMELDRLQRKQHVTRQLMDMTRLQPFLESLDQFRSVLGPSVGMNSFLAFILGPMRVMLQVNNSENVPSSLPG